MLGKYAKFYIVAGVVSAAFILALVAPQVPVQARAEPMNDAERWVKSRDNPNGTYVGPSCDEDGDGYNIGALWVTNDVENPDPNKVVVNGNDSSVSVRIYSTVMACGPVSKRVADTSQVGHIDSNYRSALCPGVNLNFSVVEKSTQLNLWKANYEWFTGSYQPTKKYISNRNRPVGENWSTNFQNDNYIKAILYLGSTTETGNKTLCINSNYSIPGGLCGDSGRYCWNSDRRVGVRVERTHPFTITPTISVNKTAAIPDEVITWSHSVENTGAANTSSSGTFITGRYQNVKGTGTWNDGSGPNHNTSGALRGRERATRTACVDVPDGSTANVTLRIYRCNNTLAQEWLVEPGSDNRIRNVNSNRCLDVPGGVTTVGTVVTQHSCNGSVAQQWVYNPDTGTIHYRNTSSNRCLDRDQNGTANGTKLQIHTCNGTAAQQWMLDNSARTYLPNWASTTNAVGSTGNQWVASLNKDQKRDFNSTYRVRDQDVGGSVCRRTAAGRTSLTNYNWVYSSPVCVSVPYNYTLKPAVTNIVDGQAVEFTGNPQTVTGQINNEGPTKSRPDVGWELTQIEFDVALASIPRKEGAENQTSNPCAYFINEVSCNTIGSNTIAGGISNGGSASRNALGDLSDKPAGRKICFVMSVKPYNATTENWSHSPMKCLIAGKKPKTQVHSGDLFVGRASETNPTRVSDVVTSTSLQAGAHYGSWVEYGIVPTGCVTNMASASGYSGGSSPSKTHQQLSILSLTTPGSAVSKTCNVGGYNSSNPAPNVAARFPINVSVANASQARPASPQALPSASVNLSNLSGSYQAPANTPSITVTASNRIPAGRWVVLNVPNATVTINSDIQYANSALSELKDIPQVIIIARNIIIADNVRQIDSWLVAVGSDVGSGVNLVRHGNINTCGAGGTTARPVTQTSALTIADCAQQLTVNGPVIANHLILRRTFGAGVGADAQRPAEVFNLRPDSYIWATGYNQSSGRISTAATKELPPRF